MILELIVRGGGEEGGFKNSSTTCSLLWTKSYKVFTFLEVNITTPYKVGIAENSHFNYYIHIQFYQHQDCKFQLQLFQSQRVVSGDLTNLCDLGPG